MTQETAQNHDTITDEGNLNQRLKTDTLDLNTGSEKPTISPKAFQTMVSTFVMPTVGEGLNNNQTTQVEQLLLVAENIDTTNNPELALQLEQLRDLDKEAKGRKSDTILNRILKDSDSEEEIAETLSQVDINPQNCEFLQEEGVNQLKILKDGKLFGIITKEQAIMAFVIADVLLTKGVVLRSAMQLADSSMGIAKFLGMEVPDNFSFNVDRSNYADFLNLHKDEHELEAFFLERTDTEMAQVTKNLSVEEIAKIVSGQEFQIGNKVGNNKWFKMNSYNLDKVKIKIMSSLEPYQKQEVDALLQASGNTDQD